MSSLLERLRNRQATADELQGITTVAQEESQRLNTLLGQTHAAVRELTALQHSTDGLEHRLSATRADLKKFEAQMESASALVTLVENLDQKVRSLGQLTDQSIQRIEESETKTTEIQGAKKLVVSLLQASQNAEDKIQNVQSQIKGLSTVETEIKRLEEDLESFRSQFDLILADYERTRDTAQSLRRQSTVLEENARAVKTELDRASQVKQEISDLMSGVATSQLLFKKTEQQLRHLNALAEHVAKKVKSLTVTKELVERANAQCGQVNELVWDTESKLKKVTEQGEQIKEAQASIDRLHDLYQEVQAKIADADQTRIEHSQQSAKLKEEMESTVSAIRRHLESAKVVRQELDVANGRVVELNSNIGALENRLKNLAARDQEIVNAVKKAHVLQAQTDALQDEVEGIQGKVQGLEGVEKRLDEVSQISSKLDHQLKVIVEARPLVEETGNRLSEFAQLRSDTQTQLENLRQTQEEVEKTNQRFVEFRKASVGTEAVIKQIVQRLGTVDELSARIVSLQNLSGKLETRATELGTRLEFVDAVESRLNNLNELSRNIDSRIVRQLSKDGELESMRVAQEGLAIQLADIQKLVDSIKGSRTMTELEDRTVMLESRLVAFQEKLKGAEHLEHSLVEGEKRTKDMANRLDDLSGAAGSQSDRIGSLKYELDKLNDSRKEWLQEVHRLETRQQEIGRRSEETEFQLNKIADFSKQLDEKRNRMLVSETKLARYEQRVSSLETLLQNLDAKLGYIHSRQESVEQIKRQVDILFNTCDRTRKDAMAVLSARKEITDAKDLLETLQSRAEAVEQKFKIMDEKQNIIDEAEVRINALSHVIGDIHVNIQHFKQQKTVIDHVAEKLAQLDFTIKQAEVLTKELQEERRLAGRIYQAIRSMRKPEPAQPPSAPRAPHPTPNPVGGR